MLKSVKLFYNNFDRTMLFIDGENLVNMESMETLHCPDDGLLEIGLGLPIVVPGNVKIIYVLTGSIDKVDKLVHVHCGNLVSDLDIFHIVYF